MTFYKFIYNFCIGWEYIPIYILYESILFFKVNVKKKKNTLITQNLMYLNDEE